MGWKILGRAEKALIIKKIKDAKTAVFFLDYDGTLTPIRKKPHYARIKKETRDLLKRLSGRKGTRVFILSGRSISDIKSLLRLNTIYYIGNHGIELKGPRGYSYIYPPAVAAIPAVQRCYRALRKKIKFKGIALENKKYTLSLHYRGAFQKDVPLIKKIFRNTIKGLKDASEIRVTSGKKVLEVRPNIDWDKGKILSKVLKQDARKKELPVCIGDDRTDEDAFRALKKKGVSVVVSKHRKKTLAHYRLESPEKVVMFLKSVLQET